MFSSAIYHVNKCENLQINDKLWSKCVSTFSGSTDPSLQPTELIPLHVYEKFGASIMHNQNIQSIHLAL